MEQSTGSKTDIEDSSFHAQRDIVSIGGNQYNYQSVPVSPSTELKQLERALDQNRRNVVNDETRLEMLVRTGHSLSSNEIQASIKNALASIGSIDTLVHAIRLRGGNASFASQDVSPAERLNAAIQRGQTARRIEQEERRFRTVGNTIMIVLGSVILLVALSWLVSFLGL